MDTVSGAEVPEPEIEVTLAMIEAGARALCAKTENPRYRHFDYEPEEILAYWRSLALCVFVEMERARRAEVAAMPRRRPTIHELEVILAEPDTEVEVLPNGEVRAVPPPGYRSASEDEPERRGDAGRMTAIQEVLKMCDDSLIGFRRDPADSEFQRGYEAAINEIQAIAIKIQEKQL